MKQISVYLEFDDRGRCMAHLPDLPGCHLRAVDRESAMAELPVAVAAYNGWLRRHGEAATIPDEGVQFQVRGEMQGSGPFAPGDVAALFEWDRKPLTSDELRRYLQLATYQRADLIALTRELPASVVKWVPDPDSMSIERVMRHIGEAEQWYISRLLPPERLPKPWSEDAGMPLRQFLRMTRSTAEACLRRLEQEELANIHVPTHFTEKPGEPWTARKVMRRFLEHEREHIDHIRQLLAGWRRHQVARLAAERSHLFWQLRGLDEETMSSEPVSGKWSVKDLLAHVGLWDAFHTGRLSKIRMDRVSEIEPLGDQSAVDARNEALFEAFKSLPPEMALAVSLKERNAYLAELSRWSDDQLHSQITMPWGWRTRASAWLRLRHRHDAAHAAELVKWRRRLPREVTRRPSPRFVLRAILYAARKEFLSLAALVPASERNRQPVCGVWTLKDLVGHLTDWELVGVGALRQLVDGVTPEFESDILDFNAFNNANAAARSSQPWEDVWQEFHETRDTFLDLLASLPDSQLSRLFTAPWRRDIRAYQWILIWPGHEREHALDLRQALRIPNLPKRLRHLH